MGHREKNDRERSRPSKKGRRKPGPEDDDVRASACRSITGAGFPAYLRPVAAPDQCGVIPSRADGEGLHSTHSVNKLRSVLNLDCARSFISFRMTRRNSRPCEKQLSFPTRYLLFVARRWRVVTICAPGSARRGLHQRVRSRRSIMEQTAR
jgi:hypothetical protein